MYPVVALDNEAAHRAGEQDSLALHGLFQAIQSNLLCSALLLVPSLGKWIKDVHSHTGKEPGAISPDLSKGLLYSWEGMCPPAQ